MVLKVVMNHIHPIKYPCTVVNNVSTPFGSLPRLSTSELISYLFLLLQYQIMYYVLARHLATPENHLFSTVMRVSSNSRAGFRLAL